MAKLSLKDRYKKLISGAKSGVKKVVRGVGSFVKEAATNEKLMRAFDERTRQQRLIQEEQMKDMRSRYYKVPSKK